MKEALDSGALPQLSRREGQQQERCAADAKATCQAVTRPTMLCVSGKTVEQRSGA